MYLEQEAISQIKIAERRLSKADNMLKAALLETEIDDCAKLNWMSIEESYVASIDAINSMSFALEELNSELSAQDTKPISKNLFDFEASFDARFGFQFKFSRLPNLKSKRGVSRLSERFIIETGQKIIHTIPSDYVKMKDAYIIFVSHFPKNGPHKSLYFDNDNLAIKAILDVIIPLVCIDDATRYCDNLYLSQDDTREYSELFVVDKPHIKVWAKSESSLDFARAFL